MRQAHHAICGTWLSDECAGWQVLPLVPPEEAFWSPYTGLDALCGNTLLISLDGLVKDGLLEAADLPSPRPTADVDFPKACFPAQQY